MSNMNREMYQSLIDEDIAWLRGHTPSTLERMHTIAVLQQSVDLLYGKYAGLRTHDALSKEDALNEVHDTPIHDVQAWALRQLSVYDKDPLSAPMVTLIDVVRLLVARMR